MARKLSEDGDQRERDRFRGEEHLSDPQVARVLAQYVDLLAEGNETAAAAFFSSHAERSPRLADAMRTLENLRAVMPAQEWGQKSFGDFKCLRVAGRGGMGVVFEAQQVSLERRVALKVLPEGFVSDERAVRRFHREAKVTAGLRHPNIVSVHAMGTEAGVPYYAMEYVDGLTLQQLLRELEGGFSPPVESSAFRDSDFSRALTPAARLVEAPAGSEPQPSRGRPAAPLAERLPDELAEILAGAATGGADGISSIASLGPQYCLWMAAAFAGAAEGLQEAHAHGIVHRDLKPSNLILERDGRLRILDFGLAMVEGQGSLTLSLERLGTPLYMSPEQARGAGRDLGPTTDVYSLGATLYEALSWTRPSEGRSSQEILENIIHRDAEPLRRRNPRVPVDLETVVEHCLEKNPSHRYPTAGAVAEELRRVVRGDSIVIPALRRHQRVARRAWRARRKIAQTTGALAFLLTLGVLLWGSAVRSERERLYAYKGRLRSAAILLSRAELRSPANGLEGVRTRGFEVRFVHEGPILESEGHRGEEGLIVGGPQLVDFWPRPDKGRRELVNQAASLLQDAGSLVDDDPAAPFLAARTRLALGDLPGVRDRLKRALELNSQFAPALVLAKILEESGEYTMTAAQRANAARVARSDPQWMGAWLDACRSARNGRWSDAANAYQRLFAAAGEGLASYPDAYPGWEIEVRARAGIAYLKNGMREKAQEQFALIQDEMAVESRLFLGMIAGLNRSWRNAERIFHKVIANVPKSDQSEVARMVAGVYREVGNAPRARSWVQNVAEPRTRTLMRLSLFCLVGNFKGASREALDLLQRNPSDPVAHACLGNVSLAQEKLEGAFKEYQTAQAMDTGDARFAVGLGVCLELQGKSRDAESFFRKALSLDSHSRPARYNLARILAEHGLVREAAAEYRQVIAEAPCPAAAHNNLGTLLDRQGELEAARKHYAAATYLAPLMAVAHYNLASALHRQRRFVDAAEEYAETIRLGLDEAIVHRNLAVALQAQSRLDEAVKEYQIALKMHPGDARALHSLATALHRQGKLKKAIEYYHKAVKLEPGWKNAHNALAYAYLLDHQYDAAISEYKVVLSLDPRFVHAHNDLAVLMQEARREIPSGAELVDAVRRLEDATLLVGANEAIPSLLTTYRAALAPDQATYASIRAVVDSPEVLVSDGALWEWYDSRAEPSEALEWTGASAADGGWRKGGGGFGSAAEGERTVLEDMEGRSLYVRHSFDVQEKARIEKLLLSVRLGGGFVAYLNGFEVARLRAGAPGVRLPFNAVSDKGEEHTGVYRVFELDCGRLVAGANNLALHVVNSPNGKPGFSFNAILKASVVFDDKSLQRARQSSSAFESAASGPNVEARLAYFEGCILRRSGRVKEAAEKFREVLALDTSRPEPFSSLAGCLEALGDPPSAEATVRGALNAGFTWDPRLWNTWLRLVMVKLGWAPESIQASLPPPREDDPEWVEDIPWILDQLAAGNDIRINSGGGAYRDGKGRHWSRDRFFCDGWAEVLPSLADPILLLEDLPIFETERFYEHFQLSRGYRVPLPPARYRVTLLFVEGWFRKRNLRRYDVLLEGKAVLEDYEPIHLGFGVVDRREFTIPVKDGALDIDFDRRIENPKISAFTIERVGGL